jgi:rhodanese-related sulfurtransferase
LNTPDNYNVYNYWKEEDFTGIGHFKGAYRHHPVSFDNVDAFPQSDEFQFYCYTGQTSSMAVAWLQVLGYNAKSITYGVNSLSHTAVDAANPNTAWHKSKDYPYESTK